MNNEFFLNSLPPESRPTTAPDPTPTPNKKIERIPRIKPTNYPCNNCDKIYSNFNALKRHADRIHLDHFPYPCSQCYWTFATKNLRAHHVSVECPHFECRLLMANQLISKGKGSLNYRILYLDKTLNVIKSLEEKSQNAINENAKLKVKQKEDTKLRKGLESKFSSTKALCDQLTETLQYLAGQVLDAEQDKNVFEDKLSASLNALIRKNEKQLMELRTKKEEKEKGYLEEFSRITSRIEEKDVEGPIASWCKLVQQEKDLTLKRAQRQFDQLHDSFSQVTSENGAFRSENEEVRKKVIELQKGQEVLMVQLQKKTMLLRKDLEGQIRALRCQHEDECQKFQEQLECQKSKEERQRALLQSQWKGMDGNPPEDQEVNSKKANFISSIKKRDSDGKNRNQSTIRPHKEGKMTNKILESSPLLRATQTPVSNILKKVEKVDTGGVKHSRKRKLYTM